MICFCGQIRITIVAALLIAGCKEKEEEPEVVIDACFNAPTELQRGESGTFDASCSVNAELYRWDFGDGTQATGSQSTHSYANPGVYKVKLEIETAGKVDTVSHKVTALADPASCLPSYFAGATIYPGATNFAGTPDSLVFTYLPNGKLDQIRWWVPKPATLQNTAKLVYDSEGKVIRVESTIVLTGQVVASFIYDNNKKPVRMNLVKVSGNDSLWVANYKHDQNGNLVEVTTRTASKIPQENVNNRVRYELDAAGNAKKVFYTLPGKSEMLVRENKAFFTNKTAYASSIELKFYMEYLGIREPYINYPKTSFLLYARLNPEGNGFAYYGQRQTDGTYPGFEFEYELKLSPLGLPQSYKPTISGGSGNMMIITRSTGFACK